MTKRRSLGHSGLSTAPLVLGGNVFGWTADEQTSFDILDAFVAGGGNMIDSADVYSGFAPGLKGGESEAVIGRWMKSRGNRDKVLVATKVGYLLEGDRQLGGLKPERILTIVEESLARLQTDYIDLYYAHVDDEATPLEDVLETFDRLIRAGKVRCVAASNYSPERLEDALQRSEAKGLTSYVALQSLYNLLDRDKFEGPLRQLCLDRGIGFVPFFGLASGFLTGKYRSAADLEGKARADMAGHYLNERGLAVLEVLDEVAGETGSVPAQVALAWLAAQPAVTAPIASATSLSQAETLVGAMHLSLSAEQIGRLNEVSRPD